MSVDFEPLGDVVDEFSFGALEAVRPDPVDSVNGRLRSTADVVLEASGSFWPVSGRRRTQLTEGGRFNEPYDIYTDSESVRLQCVNDTDGTPGDILTIEGDSFEVVQEHQWREGLFGHYIASRIRRRDP